MFCEYGLGVGGLNICEGLHIEAGVVFNIISKRVCLAGCVFDGERGVGRLEIFLGFWDQLVAHSSFQ